MFFIFTLVVVLSMIVLLIVMVSVSFSYSEENLIPDVEEQDNDLQVKFIVKMASTSLIFKRKNAHKVGEVNKIVKEKCLENNVL